MNDLMIFSNPEFGAIRTVEINNEPWFVGKDVCAVFLDKNHNRSLGRVDDADKTVVPITDSMGRKQQVTIINESGLYALLFSMQPQKANNDGVSNAYPIEIQERIDRLRKFKRWVTSEVLPSIRKTGGYNIPKDYPSALRALADKAEEVAKLAAENEVQRQAIADFEPMRQYLDTILASTGTMATSQIAADYDMSARRLNIILHEEGIQHNVNGQWILYKKYMGKGYTKSETIPIVRTDGSPDTKIMTKWTQKGRIMIHEILTKRGIQAVMDKRKAS